MRVTPAASDKASAASTRARQDMIHRCEARSVFLTGRDRGMTGNPPAGRKDGLAKHAAAQAGTL
jgi:hypothetical protein